MSLMSYNVYTHTNDFWCQAKFLICEISDFTPCAHALSDILHIKYADKTNDDKTGD